LGDTDTGILNHDRKIAIGESHAPLMHQQKPNGITSPTV